MSTFFELSAECAQLYEWVDDGDDQAFLDTLEGLQGEISQKAESYVALINQFEMEAAAADLKQKQFKARMDARKNAVKRLKEALLAGMQMMDVKEMQAGDYKLKIAKNGGVQPLKITGDVPDNMTKVIVEPDNDKIRAFLKEQPDNACEWAELQERGVHLTIK